MNRPRIRKQLTLRRSLLAIAAALFLLAFSAVVLWFAFSRDNAEMALRYVSTIAGLKREFGEPFGIAVMGSKIYVSDGQNGKIWLANEGILTVFADNLDTPSGIAFEKTGNLIVADSGSHTIKSIDARGSVTTVAGVDNRSGFLDGDSSVALFNAPIGVAVAADGKIFVADTYNDRIRVIQNGIVSTLAGGIKGYADGLGEATKFDTPTGIAVWLDKLLVADTGTRRIRVIEPDRRVWTLAGSGEGDLTDGSLYSASFVQPTGVAVDTYGSIFVTDGNAIRKIGGTFPIVSTISAKGRGIKDGIKLKARFNRPSGLAITDGGNLLIADSENRLIRRFSAQSGGHEISADEIGALRDKPDEFRVSQPPRWPFDPPNVRRDIAGTLGEVRGEVKNESDQVWFHNGLDIAGAYGETARFIRDEKVLRPVASENFGTSRELIRMPALGYIHIRLGRNEGSIPFADGRFLFEKDSTGKLAGVRVPRGAKFKAGEAIGTLNSMNHVHLVAGPSGAEMNALDALNLPGITDSRPPVIEEITIFGQNWKPLETDSHNSRITLMGKSRVVVRAYDQVDGNSERRRLGVFKLGYQILDAAKNPLGDIKWTITFSQMPPNAAVRLVYANESHSGATGETLFNYIVTNFVAGDQFREDFLDPAVLERGNLVLRVSAADYSGNISSKDVMVSVK